MKRVLLAAVCQLSAAFVIGAAFIFAATGSVQAQTIAGTWQGSLPIYVGGQGSAYNNGQPRVAFTIEKSADGAFRGEIAFIDRGATTPLSSVTFAAPEASFAESGAGFTFRGKLSADGKSIAGTWTQGNQSFPLTLKLATADTLWVREGPAPLKPMAADADPAYEVATIKPATADEQHPIFDLRTRRFNATGTSAKELIKIAWNVRGRQVIGGPAWIEEKKYDIAAEPDTAGLPSEEQSRTMVRKLLAERFNLAAHTGQQVYPVLALTLDTKAPRPVPADPNFIGSGGMSGRRDGDEIVLQFSGTTIPQMLAFVMNTFQDRQLVDETGLTGIYNITLRIAIPSPGPVSSDDIGAALIEAAEHAGFKFIAKKEAIPIVIIDHIDPPTPN
jgi:uncharacterized protein (TIGR03435 family)